MVIKTKTAEVSYDHRGFLRINFLNNNESLDLDEAKAHVEAGKQLTSGKKMPVLVDVRNSFHVPTAEAKKYLAEMKLKTAEAILTKSLSHRLIGNFYSGMVRAKNKNYPIKMFNNEKEAIAWLIKNK